MEDNRSKYGARSTYAQVGATLAFQTLMINVGLIIGMPTLIIGALRLNDSTLKFTEEQASWFGGLVFMVQPLGSVASGFLQDLLGRKTCMMAVNIPLFTAWIMMYFANSVSTLFVALVIFGLSIGFMEAPVLSYIGEISEPHLRGVLSTLGGVSFTMGLVVLGFIGVMTDWRTMVLLCSTSSIIAFLALSVVPESPAWLLTKGRSEDAQKAYQWLRGWVGPEVVQEEFNQLLTYIKHTRQPCVVSVGDGQLRRDATEEGAASHPTAQEPPESKLKIFLHPSVQRPLRLIVTYFFISTCASLCAMRPFFIEIVAEMKLPIRPHLVVMFSSALTMLGSITSTLTMRHLGKRGLTFISLGLSVICCFGLGLYLALGVHNPWIPLLLFSVSFYISTVGIIPIPWIFISELFPLKGRGLAGGVSAAFGYFIIFIIIKTFYTIVSMIEISGACFLYGSVGIAGFIYFYFNLPETENIPLEVIEGLFVDHKTNVNCLEPLNKKGLQTERDDVSNKLL